MTWNGVPEQAAWVASMMRTCPPADLQALADASISKYGFPPDTRARIEALPDDGWLPIESAPFDREILLFALGQQYVGLAYSKDEDADPEIHERGQRWVIYDGKHCHAVRGAYPTHWRPLPAPPGTPSTKSAVLGILDGEE